MNLFNYFYKRKMKERVEVLKEFWQWRIKVNKTLENLDNESKKPVIDSRDLMEIMERINAITNYLKIEFYDELVDDLSYPPLKRPQKRQIRARKR